MLKIEKKKIYYFLLFIIISTNTHFFNDLYNIYIRKYEERMIRTYDYCDGISYGFIKKIKDNYLKVDKKIYIINNDIFPSSLSLFPDLQSDKIDKKDLILLNFPTISKETLLKFDLDLNNYDLILKEFNCYYLKKK